MPAVSFATDIVMTLILPLSANMRTREHHTYNDTFNPPYGFQLAAVFRISSMANSSLDDVNYPGGIDRYSQPKEDVVLDARCSAHRRHLRL